MAPTTLTDKILDRGAVLLLANAGEPELETADGGEERSERLRRSRRPRRD